MNGQQAARNASTPVRVSSGTYQLLKELSAESGQPIVRYLDGLVQDAYEQRIWQQFAEANRRLQDDPVALAAQQAEEAIWAAADADGLDPDDGVPVEDTASW